MSSGFFLIRRLQLENHNPDELYKKIAMNNGGMSVSTK